MAPNTELAPLALSVRETTVLLGIGYRKCLEAVYRGEIPAIRIGERWLIPRVRLEALVEGATTEPKMPIS